MSNEVATGRRMKRREGLTGLSHRARGAGRPPDSETLLPSCNLSTPSVTTVSPGVSPETISVRSPSAVPSVTVRTVTVRSGWTR